MFTIRHMTPAGNEALYEATEVSFTPTPQAPLDQPAYAAAHQLGTLWLISPDPKASRSEITDGRAYVMNDAGATVASYDLGGWLGPQS